MEEDRKGTDAAIFARIVEALPPSIDPAAQATRVTLATLGRDTHLRRDLGLDSLGLASFLFRCGEALDVDQDALIDALSEAPVSTIGDAVAAFARLLGGEAQA